MNVRRTGRRLQRLRLQRPSAERRTRTGTDVSQVSNVELQRQNRRGKICPGWSQLGGIQKKTSVSAEETPRVPIKDRLPD